MILAGLMTFPAVAAAAEGAKFIFDATKAEMSADADWVIDTDIHTLRVTSGNGSGRVMSINSYISIRSGFPIQCTTHESSVRMSFAWIVMGLA